MRVFNAVIRTCSLCWKRLRMATHNEFLVMTGHTSSSDAEFGDDVQLKTSATQSFYNRSAYDNERSPLLICTPTRNHTKKSSVLYTNNAAMYKVQKPSGSRYV